jgi:hypothetical protein
MFKRIIQNGVRIFWSNLNRACSKFSHRSASYVQKKTINIYSKLRSPYFKIRKFCQRWLIICRKRNKSLKAYWTILCNVWIIRVKWNTI